MMLSALRLRLPRARLLLAGCSSVLGPGAGRPLGDNMAPLVSETGDPEDDMIGARENPRIVAAYGGIYSDRPAEIMLAQIVGKLLAAADQPNTRFTVTILDSAEVNAFALPGGYIYVTRGILALANDQSELAAVLAHEIAHVVLKHRARPHQPHPDHRDRRQGGDRRVRRRSVDRPDAQQGQAVARRVQPGAGTGGRQGRHPDRRQGGLRSACGGALPRRHGPLRAVYAGDADQDDDFLSSHPSTPDRIQKATESARAFFGAPGLGNRRAPTT